MNYFVPQTFSYLRYDGNQFQFSTKVGESLFDLQDRVLGGGMSDKRLEQQNTGALLVNGLVSGATYVAVDIPAQAPPPLVLDPVISDALAELGTPEAQALLAEL